VSVDLTILMNTCRDDYCLVGLPDVFLFEPTVKSLNRQRLRNFELVVVDALYSEARRRWLHAHAEFPVKYVNAHPNRWLERGMCGIATQKNTGLLHAEGEVVVFMDDCTQLPDWWTKRVWGWVERGFWPMSLTYYYEGGKPKVLGRSQRYVERFYGRLYDKEEGLHAYLKPGETVRDSRASLVDAHGVVKAPGSWFYGGSSASLEALLKVNGVDERFDGKKGLEDADTGLRLEAAGYRGLFLLDTHLWHVEHWHKSLSARVLHYRGSTPACNYGLLQYNRVKGAFKANVDLLTREDCLWIKRRICPKCDNRARCVNEEFKGEFYVEGEGFETWLNLQRTFNLREERLNVEM